MPIGFGQGSPLLGGTGGLVRSMMNGSPSPLQQSPSSVGFDPNLQVPAYPQMPDKSPMTAIPTHQMEQPSQQPTQQSQQPGIVTIPGVQDAAPQQPGLQIPLSEAQLIVKTLGARLNHLSKKEIAPTMQM